MVVTKMILKLTNPYHIFYIQRSSFGFLHRVRASDVSRGCVAPSSGWMNLVQVKFSQLENGGSKFLPNVKTKCPTRHKSPRQSLEHPTHKTENLHNWYVEQNRVTSILNSNCLQVMLREVFAAVWMADPFLGAFAKLQKAAISFVMSVSLPGRIFVKIYSWIFFIDNLSRKFKFY